MTSPQERTKALTAVSVVLALVFLGSGGAKLAGVEMLAENFERYGFGREFMTFIGACEVAGAVGLFIPKLAWLAAAGLAAVMGGAVWAHATHDPIAESAAPAVLLALCVYVAAQRRPA